MLLSGSAHQIHISAPLYGRILNILHFADDRDLMGGVELELQELTIRQAREIAKVGGLKTN